LRQKQREQVMEALRAQEDWRGLRRSSALLWGGAGSRSAQVFKRGMQFMDKPQDEPAGICSGAFSECRKHGWGTENAIEPLRNRSASTHRKFGDSRVRPGSKRALDRCQIVWLGFGGAGLDVESPSDLAASAAGPSRYSRENFSAWAIRQNASIRRSTLAFPPALG